MHGMPPFQVMHDFRDDRDYVLINGSFHWFVHPDPTGGTDHVTGGEKPAQKAARSALFNHELLF